MSIEYRIQKKLEEYFNDLYEMEALGWKDIEAKTNSLCAVAREIENLSWEADGEDYYESPAQVHQNYHNDYRDDKEMDYRPRRINFRRENFNFWKGFMDYAFKDPQFAAAFRQRKPEDKQWLTFHWTLPSYQTFRVYYMLTIEDNEITERKAKIEGRLNEEVFQTLQAQNLDSLDMVQSEEGLFAQVLLDLSDDRDQNYSLITASMIDLRNMIFNLLTTQAGEEPEQTIETVQEEESLAPDQEDAFYNE